jgi:hypothetical protein
MTRSLEATTRRETPPCCSGYVVGGSATGTWRGRDRWTTSTRLRNSFASSTKRKIVTPETNVVFMTPSSASGRSFSSEGDLNNHYDGSASRQYINTLIVGKRPLVWAPPTISSQQLPQNSVHIKRVAASDTRFNCNLLVVNTSKIHVVKCIDLDI